MPLANPLGVRGLLPFDFLHFAKGIAAYVHKSAISGLLTNQALSDGLAARFVDGYIARGFEYLDFLFSFTPAPRIGVSKNAPSLKDLYFGRKKCEVKHDLAFMALAPAVIGVHANVIRDTAKRQDFCKLAGLWTRFVCLLFDPPRYTECVLREIDATARAFLTLHASGADGGFDPAHTQKAHIMLHVTHLIRAFGWVWRQSTERFEADMKRFLKAPGVCTDRSAAAGLQILMNNQLRMAAAAAVPSAPVAVRVETIYVAFPKFALMSAVFVGHPWAFPSTIFLVRPPRARIALAAAAAVEGFTAELAAGATLYRSLIFTAAITIVTGDVIPVPGERLTVPRFLKQRGTDEKLWISGTFLAYTNADTGTSEIGEVLYIWCVGKASFFVTLRLYDQYFEETPLDETVRDERKALLSHAGYIYVFKSESMITIPAESLSQATCLVPDTGYMAAEAAAAAAAAPGDAGDPGYREADRLRDELTFQDSFADMKIDRFYAMGFWTPRDGEAVRGDDGVWVQVGGEVRDDALPELPSTRPGWTEKLNASLLRVSPSRLSAEVLVGRLLLHYIPAGEDGQDGGSWDAGKIVRYTDESSVYNVVYTEAYDGQLPIKIRLRIDDYFVYSGRQGPLPRPGSWSLAVPNPVEVPAPCYDR